MSLSARRGFGDALLFAGGILVLLVALTATNDRVRERALTLVGSGPPPVAGITSVGARAGDLVVTMIHVTRAWAGDHVYLSIFAVTAFVLFLAALRL